MDAYIVVKKAVYDHGVMWIGSDIEEGKKKADYFASNNDDGHHRYELRRFVEPSKSDTEDDYCIDWVDECELIYTGIKAI